MLCARAPQQAVGGDGAGGLAAAGTSAQSSGLEEGNEAADAICAVERVIHRGCIAWEDTESPCIAARFNASAYPEEHAVRPREILFPDRFFDYLSAENSHSPQSVGYLVESVGVLVLGQCVVVLAQTVPRSRLEHARVFPL